MITKSTMKEERKAKKSPQQTRDSIPLRHPTLYIPEILVYTSLGTLEDASLEDTSSNLHLASFYQCKLGRYVPLKSFDNR